MIIGDTELKIISDDIENSGNCLESLQPCILGTLFTSFSIVQLSSLCTLHVS